MLESELRVGQMAQQAETQALLVGDPSFIPQHHMVPHPKHHQMWPKNKIRHFLKANPELISFRVPSLVAEI